MRNFFTLILLFFVSVSWAQNKVVDLYPKLGPYKIGFGHYNKVDDSRTYERSGDWTNKVSARPMSISLWYPAESSGAADRISVLDYMEILKEEEEWEYLPTEQILNWFEFPNNEKNRAILPQEGYATKDAIPSKGKFPMVIYTPGFGASSIENFAICEFLTSHGFYVMASPSVGPHSRRLEGATSKDLENQARDVEFLISEALKLPYVNTDKITLMGFSFGGMSNALVGMRNARVKAIVSLDGSERYNYSRLSDAPYFDLKRFDVPYLHLAQKEIPQQVLKEDNIPEILNTEFRFFDELVYSDAYKMRMHYLSHSQFSALGVLMKPRDPRQDKSDGEIILSYQWVVKISSAFLNAYLNDTSDGGSTFGNYMAGQNLPKAVMSGEYKKPVQQPMSLQDFHELAIQQEYNELRELYNDLKSANPNLEFPEGSLNNLGLHLVFNPETSKYGIKIFLLAVSLYPNSSNLYDSLAEGYLFIGDKPNAILNFKKSLALYSNNMNAIKRLEELKEE
ncbi:MAG: alpha/beta hydrolase [Bacteroidota bacterium]